MSKGVEFYFKRVDKRVVMPPFSTSGELVFGRAADGGSSLIVGFMHDYYSVSAEEQRRMAENTIALCELLYSQEVSNV